MLRLCGVLALGLLVGTCRGESCTFQLEEARVVGYGELMSYPGLWNNQGSTITVVDRVTGNILLYPQMALYAEFFDTNTNKTHTIDPDGEVFMLFSPGGRHLWTARAFSTTFPVLDEDVYILNEQRVEKLAKENGQRRWVAPLCLEYVSSRAKQVGDVFGILHADSTTELAVGLLMTGQGHCGIQAGSVTHNLTSATPEDPTRGTPYIVYLSKDTGKAMRLEQFPPIKADLVRSALRQGGNTTFLGMQTSDKQASVQHIVQFSATAQQRWETAIRTPHPHNFLWSQSHADDVNDHVLFIADPTGEIQINRDTLKHRGLVFGGLSLADGSVLWRKELPYRGIITSTFIQFMDEDLVLLGAIWDGEDDLELGVVRLPKLRRPVQGMLGFFGVFDVAAQQFLFVQEVAPELVYPGHHVGLFKLPEGAFQVVTCPAFWDEAPQRLLDNRNSVDLPQPDKDSLVLVRYRYNACHGTSGTSTPHHRGRAAKRLGQALMWLLGLMMGGGALLGCATILKRQGFALPSLGVPNFFGRGRYGILSGNDDDDPFQDIDYENDPL